MRRIYLDYAASTPLDPLVRKAMTPYWNTKYGNPGSLHSFGQEALASVDRARETIAKAIGADFRNILFTGSATEANNFVLRGVVRRFFDEAKRNRKPSAARPKIITSVIEHESVLETALDLGEQGVEVVRIPVDKFGAVSAREVVKAIDERTILVSIMYANNEIGTVEPIAHIGRAIADVRASRTNSSAPYPFFHTDAVQGFQCLPCDVRELGVDYVTLSGHKIYGPKGIGVLYSKNRTLHPILTGGSQEFALRSGTENVPSIVGLGRAVELVLKRRASLRKRLSSLTERFWGGIKKNVRKAEVNGVPFEERTETNTLPNILNIHFPGYRGAELLLKFDRRGLAASAGSACTARSTTPSHVLSALGYSLERVTSSVRFSFGYPTTERDVDRAIAVITMSLHQ